MKKIRLNSFTLLELMMYLSLASVIIFSTTILVANTLQLREKSRAIFEVESQGDFLTRQLTQTIKYADAIISPAPGETSPSLTVQVSEVDLNPTVIAGSDDEITIKEGLGEPTGLTSAALRAKDIQFQNLSPSPAVADTIKISFTLEYKTEEERGGFQYEKTFSTSATIRSHPKDED